MMWLSCLFFQPLNYIGKFKSQGKIQSHMLHFGSMSATACAGLSPSVSTAHPFGNRLLILSL